jgi:hypothetical protein
VLASFLLLLFLWSPSLLLCLGGTLPYALAICGIGCSSSLEYIVLYLCHAS